MIRLYESLASSVSGADSPAGPCASQREQIKHFKPSYHNSFIVTLQFIAKQWLKIICGLSTSCHQRKNLD